MRLFCLICVMCIFTVDDNNAEVTLFDLFGALKDAQELVDAMNDRDFVLMAIKLIDIKMEVDPPATYQGRVFLLDTSDELKQIYPYYSAVHQTMKNYTDRIDQGMYNVTQELTKTFLAFEENMNKSLDQLKEYGNQIKRLNFELPKSTTSLVEHCSNVVNYSNNATENIKKIVQKLESQTKDIVNGEKAVSDNINKNKTQTNNSQINHNINVGANFEGSTQVAHLEQKNLKDGETINYYNRNPGNQQLRQPQNGNVQNPRAQANNNPQNRYPQEDKIRNPQAGNAILQKENGNPQLRNADPQVIKGGSKQKNKKRNKKGGAG